MGAPYDLGRVGEEAAAEFLQARGYEVLARNWRGGGGELDLVVATGDLVAFVEVKTRAPGSLDGGWEAVHPAKQRKIQQAARAYAARMRKLPAAFRLDVIVVHTGVGDCRVEHLPGAWEV